MRTYEDTFSGEKIYPGKVSFTLLNRLLSWPGMSFSIVPSTRLERFLTGLDGQLANHTNGN